MDRKYTDFDVRNDSSLAGVAYEYLRQYRGDFQFLLECKAYHNQYGRLGHAHIRGVLNCMLADPKVGEMPEPRMKIFRASTLGIEDFSMPIPLVREEIAPPRPIEIPLPTRWRLTHGISNHKRSYVVHLVDAERSHAKLHVNLNKVTFQFHWLCQSHSPPRPFEQTLALFSLDDAVLMVQTGDASHIKHLTLGEKVRPWKWCAQCGRVDSSE